MIVRRFWAGIFFIAFVLLGTLPLESVEAKPVEIPVNVGVGPLAATFFGPIAEDQRYHWGLELKLAAIIDKAVLKSQRKRVPKRFRGMVDRMGQVEIGHLLIPDRFFISPRLKNTAIYGVTFRPIGINQPLVKSPFRLTIGAGLMLTYAYINTRYSADVLSDQRKTPEGTTHFLRPGLEFKAELTIPITRSFLISGGWSSALYPPQKVGEGIASFGGTEGTIWHVGRAFAMIHIRFPYMVNL
jgi:hypothetical protein